MKSATATPKFGNCCHMGTWKIINTKISKLLKIFQHVDHIFKPSNCPFTGSHWCQQFGKKSWLFLTINLERLNRHKNMPNSNKRDFQYELILKFRFNILIHSLTQKRKMMKKKTINLTKAFSYGIHQWKTSFSHLINTINSDWIQ